MGGGSGRHGGVTARKAAEKNAAKAVSENRPKDGSFSQTA
jgi:hypothetical protein